ncbi:hypothetical protein [Gordonia tangerina]|uniref:hypothetical protein n=1 Tax=Gordonia tangerina TaxID=2911060 RepID=UPI003EE412DB
MARDIRQGATCLEAGLRGLKGLREAECLDRRIHSDASGEVHDLRDRITVGGVDDAVGAETFARAMRSGRDTTAMIRPVPSSSPSPDGGTQSDRTLREDRHGATDLDLRVLGPS